MWCIIPRYSFLIPLPGTRYYRYQAHHASYLVPVTRYTWYLIMLSIGLGLEDSAAVYSGPTTFCQHNNQQGNYLYSCVQRRTGGRMYAEWANSGWAAPTGRFDWLIYLWPIPGIRGGSFVSTIAHHRLYITDHMSQIKDDISHITYNRSQIADHRSQMQFSPFEGRFFFRRLNYSLHYSTVTCSIEKRTS